MPLSAPLYNPDVENLLVKYGFSNAYVWPRSSHVSPLTVVPPEMNSPETEEENVKLTWPEEMV